MAVHSNIPFQKELNTSSERNCAFYAKCINYNNAFSKIDDSSVAIYQYLSSLDKEVREKLVCDLIRSRNATLLPDEDFKWLEEIERARSLAWLILKDAEDEEIIKKSIIHADDFFPQNTSGLSYFNAMFATRGFPGRERHLEEIKYFFDNFPVGVDNKKKLIESLKEHFATSCDEVLKISWLKKKDEEQCMWAWGYAKKAFYCRNYFKPMNHEDAYWFVIAALDYWIGYPAEKELFLMKFKKAWSQKVYRKKQEGRVPLNTYLSKSSKNMLDYLAMEREEKMYQTLERIIRKVYDESR